MGKVSNNDTINTAQTVTVNVQFFDRDDTLLGSNSDGTYSLAPGQTRFLHLQKFSLSLCQLFF
ncbi:MAG: FxLYD domain-containing protein [Nitrososphaera sp.]